MIIKFFLISCLSLFFVWSCNKQHQQNILVAHIPSDPESLHPINSGSAIASEIKLYTQLSLLKINYQTGELSPCVAKVLPKISDDGLVYNYQLDTVLTWDNQQTITTKDIDFTVKANCCLLSQSPNKSNWDNIANIKSLSLSSFEVMMKSASSFNSWIWVDCPILQANFYDKKNVLSKYTITQLRDSAFISKHTDITLWAEEFNQANNSIKPEYLDGAGVYKIIQWDKGVSITLEKKKHHWSENTHYGYWDKAGADKIIFKINSNNASAMLELKNGTLDVSTYLDYDSYRQLTNDSKFNSTHFTTLADTYNYSYIALNTKPDGRVNPLLFTDTLTRQAMSLLIPYDQINQTIFNSKSKRAVSPVSIFKKEFNNKLKPTEYNISKALELLKQGGWEDTDHDHILDKVINGKKVNFEFSINYMNVQKQWEDIAKQIAESMRKASIFVQLKPLDYNNYIGSAMNHQFDMMLGAWQTTSQPDDFSQLWHTDAWKNNGFNFTGFGNTQTDALIDSINKCVDERQRSMLSQQFQQKVYASHAYIFMFTQLRRVVVNKKWDNIMVYNEYPGVLLNTLKSSSN